jgi:hypothetical protein
MSKVKEINTEELIKELCSRGYLRVFWTEYDIKHVAENNFGKPIHLTDSQLNDVVTFIENKWDANIGVSWDTIESSIAYVLNL